MSGEVWILDGGKFMGDLWFFFFFFSSHSFERISIDSYSFLQI